MQSKICDIIWPSSSCALISISKVLSWSLSLPERHHDLHHLDLYQCVITWLSHQLLLLQLLLSYSDKVKQLFGICILCNKETTIGFLPVADNFNKTWSSHTTTYISSCLDHITSQHALQKQVRRPLLCLLQVLRGCYGLKQEPISPTHQKHNDSLSNRLRFNLRKDRA